MTSPYFRKTIIAAMFYTRQYRDGFKMSHKTHIMCIHSKFMQWAKHITMLKMGTFYVSNASFTLETYTAVFCTSIFHSKEDHVRM